MSVMKAYTTHGAIRCLQRVVGTESLPALRAVASKIALFEVGTKTRVTACTTSSIALTAVAANSSQQYSSPRTCTGATRLHSPKAARRWRWRTCIAGGLSRIPFAHKKCLLQALSEGRWVVTAIAVRPAIYASIGPGVQPKLGRFGQLHSPPLTGFG